MPKIMLSGLLIVTFTIALLSLANSNVTASSSDSSPVTSRISTTVMAVSGSPFLTYDNSTYGIRIQYPSDWVKAEYHGGHPPGFIVEFNSPLGSPHAMLKIGTNVLPNTSLEHYSAQAINDLCQSLAGSKLIESSPTTMGGLPAHKLVCTGKPAYALGPSASKITLVAVWTIKDGHDFIISAGSLPKDFSNYFLTIQHMIDSFAFTSTTSGQTSNNNSTAVVAKSTNSTSYLVNVLIDKGDALDKVGKYDDAIAYYDKALKIEQNNTEAITGKGNALDDLGYPDKAIEYYDKALAIDPNYTKALNDKGISLFKLGKNDEAISYYDRVLAIDPNNIYALTDKGASLGYLGKYNEAISLFNKALAINPTYEKALLGKKLALSDATNSTSDLIKKGYGHNNRPNYENLGS